MCSWFFDALIFLELHLLLELGAFDTSHVCGLLLILLALQRPAAPEMSNVLGGKLHFCSIELFGSCFVTLCRVLRDGFRKWHPWVESPTSHIDTEHCGVLISYSSSEQLLLIVCVGIIQCTFKD